VALPLTPARLRAITPPAIGQIEIPDGACPALRLRLSYGGKATWILGCRDSNGRARRFTIGEYPAIGLAEARERARQLRQRVRDGYDPIAEVKQRRQRMKDAVKGVGTLTALLDTYAAHNGGKLRSWGEQRRRIRDVFRAVMDKPSKEIDAETLNTIADDHASRSSANAALRYLRPVLKWAEKRGTVIKGVRRDLDVMKVTQKRTRVLDAGELRSLVRALVAAPDDPHARCLLFIMWTAARLTEATEATWGEFSGSREWVIPPERHKSNRGHRVMLPRQAAAALARWRPEDAKPNDLIFTATPSGRQAKPLTNWHRETKLLHERTGTTGWQRHDLRRSVATLAGRLGFPPHVCEALLGHLIGGSDDRIDSHLASNYNTYRYEHEAAGALQAVADELDRLAASDCDDIVRLRA
jgi:integrase